MLNELPTLNNQPKALSSLEERNLITDIISIKPDIFIRQEDNRAKPMETCRGLDTSIMYGRRMLRR